MKRLKITMDQSEAVGWLYNGQKEGTERQTLVYKQKYKYWAKRIPLQKTGSELRRNNILFKIMSNGQTIIIWMRVMIQLNNHYFCVIQQSPNVPCSCEFDFIPSKNSAIWHKYRCNNVENTIFHV
jgi:hypothetical protein